MTVTTLEGVPQEKYIVKYLGWWAQANYSQIAQGGKKFLALSLQFLYV